MRPEHLLEMRDLEDHYWWFIARRRLALSLLDQAALPAQTILDGGCGAGALLAELATRGKAYGADISESAIRITRTRGLHNLVQCDIQRAAFASETFDAILLCDVLEHVPDDNQAIAEAARMLKPGGLLIMTLPALGLLWSSHDEALGHLRRYGKRGVRRMIESMGLRVKKVSFGLSFLFPVAVVVRLVQRLTTFLGRRKPETGIIRVPPFVNELLVRLMDLENAVIKRFNLPIGVSLVVVAEKKRREDGP